MAGITLGSGIVEVEMGDDLRLFVDQMLAQLVPSLRPAMDRLINEAADEIRDEWPDPAVRAKFDKDKARAVEAAASARYQMRKAGKRIKEISFWDYMPDGHYPPPGYRATGRSRAAWRVAFKLRPGPVLEAALYNDASKGGASYAYMAKKPRPEGNKSYFKTIAIPAFTAKERELVDAMEADLGRLAGAV